MPPTASPIAARKPRAAGLSRERIVAESIAFLRENPDLTLTMARAAATVGATPMAIYRHFRDWADLADAIVEQVLEGLGAEIPTDADWREQARAWMVGLYRRLLETPQCVGMLNTSSGLSKAWLETAITLRRILQRAGLEGAQLSEGVFWISMAATGFARQTLTASMAAQIEDTTGAIARLPADQAAELAPFAADIPAIFSDALEIMVRRTIASIEAMRG